MLVVWIYAPASVNASVYEVPLCVRTALNEVPPPPLALIVISSFVVFVVIVTFEPAMNVNVSVLLSAAIVP